jgi:lipopolysaccharide/colanic/teichoic acid biosynthesis glycosyltransferase
MDVTCAATALVVLSPALAWIALAVVASQGRPILFRQRRPGLGGAPFELVKFRTMRAPRAGEVWYLTDEERLTRLGRFLRATSLDELPEFWNVLRGDMSLVGPRPLLMEYLAEYTPEESRRHDMRPGITGWAVVNGRNLLRFSDRISLDVWYVDHWSLALDLRILLMTVALVIRRQGATTTEDLALGFPLPGLDVHPTHSLGHTGTLPELVPPLDQGLLECGDAVPRTALLDPPEGVS